MPSIRQRLDETGIGYAGLDGAWWRPAAAPFPLPVALQAELVESGRALFALFDAAADLYRAGADGPLQSLLEHKVPDALRRPPGSGRVLAVRPDFQLCPTPGGGYRLVATELEICPSAQGFAHAMQVAYGLEPDLVRETIRLLRGRPLLMVGCQQWSVFLFEQMAFCRALARQGGRGQVLYDLPLADLDQEVRAGRRWRPPLFGVPQRPPAWQDDICDRLQARGLHDYWWSDEAGWPADVGDAVLFRFGYLNLFNQAALDRFAAWRAAGATWLNPPDFYLDSKALLAAARLPAVRAAVKARLGPAGLHALDRCLPETVLLTAGDLERLAARRSDWVVKLAGFDHGDQAWGGQSLAVGADHGDAAWRALLARYAALPWPAVAQRAVPSATVDISYLDRRDEPRRLRGGRTRLRVFLLRQDDDRVVACGAHVTVGGGGIGVAEGLAAVQAPVIFV